MGAPISRAHVSAIESRVQESNHFLNDKKDTFSPQVKQTVIASSISCFSVAANPATVESISVPKLKYAPSNPIEVSPSSPVEQVRNDVFTSRPEICADNLTMSAEDIGSADVLPPNINTSLSCAEEFIHFCTNNKNSSLEAIMCFLLLQACVRNRARRAAGRGV
jgi:hypothetical protein